MRRSSTRKPAEGRPDMSDRKEAASMTLNSGHRAIRSSAGMGDPRAHGVVGADRLVLEAPGMQYLRSADPTGVLTGELRPVAG